MAASLLAVLLLALQGCFVYRPAELETIRPGEDVRVVLEEGGFGRLVPGTAALGPRRLEGNFLRLTEDTLAVSVWIGEAYRGTPFEVAWQEFSIPRSDVARVEQRQLSRGRTAAVAAVSVAAILTLIESIGLTEIFGDDGGGGGPPLPPEAARLPR